MTSQFGSDNHFIISLLTVQDPNTFNGHIKKIILINPFSIVASKATFPQALLTLFDNVYKVTHYEEKGCCSTNTM